MPAHPGHKPGPGRPAGPNRYRLRDLPPGLFSRKGLLDRLGVPLGLVPEIAVRDLENRGMIQAVAHTTTNMRLYNDATVERAIELIREEESRRNLPPDYFNAKTFKTEDSLAVFASLDAGKTLIQIAIEHKIDPRYVEVIAAKYREMSGAVQLTREDMKKINAKLAPERVVFDEEGRAIKSQDIASAEDLIEAVTSIAGKASRAKVCIRCRKAPRGEECEGCVVRKIEREVQKHMNAAESAPESNAAE